MNPPVYATLFSLKLNFWKFFFVLSKTNEIQHFLITLSDEDNDVMGALFKEVEKICQVEPENFKSLFTKQQKNALSCTDNRGKRWHPLIIRWCFQPYSSSLILIQKTFVKLFETGPSHLRLTLRSPEPTDEELKRQMNELASQQAEGSSKNLPKSMYVRTPCHVQMTGAEDGIHSSSDGVFNLIHHH